MLADKVNGSEKLDNSELSDEHKREIKAALQVNQCQFDLQTVNDFISETKKVGSQTTDLKFQSFIRQERARVEDFYKESFERLIDSENVRQAERSLHPGFQKICGLKGSKLSGG